MGSKSAGPGMGQQQGGGDVPSFDLPPPPMMGQQQMPQFPMPQQQQMPQFPMAQQQQMPQFPMAQQQPFNMAIADALRLAQPGYGGNKTPFQADLGRPDDIPFQADLGRQDPLPFPPGYKEAGGMFAPPEVSGRRSGLMPQPTNPADKMPFQADLGRPDLMPKPPITNQGPGIGLTPPPGFPPGLDYSKMPPSVRSMFEPRPPSRPQMPPPSLAPRPTLPQLTLPPKAPNPFMPNTSRPIIPPRLRPTLPFQADLGRPDMMPQPRTPARPTLPLPKPRLPIR
jgi:hypothetical protein